VTDPMIMNTDEHDNRDELHPTIISRTDDDDFGDNSVSLSMIPTNSNRNKSTQQTCWCASCSQQQLQFPQDGTVTSSSSLENENDVEQISNGIQQLWHYVAHLVKCIYRETGAEFAETHSQNELFKAREYVMRLTLYNPSSLFSKLESIVLEYVDEIRNQVLKRFQTCSKTSHDVQLFISFLLEEYSTFIQAAENVSAIVADLEEHYLKEFYLTWILYNKHLYEKLIYMDRKIQHSMSTIIDLLQPNEHDEYPPAEYTLLLNRFLAFDEEMSEIACLYKECETKINMKRKEEMIQKVQQKKKQHHQAGTTMINGNTCTKGKEKQQISKGLVAPLTVSSGTKRKRQNTDPNKEKTINEQTKQVEVEKNGPSSIILDKRNLNDVRDDNSTDDTRSYTIDDLEDLDQGEEADEEGLDDEDLEDEIDEDEGEDLLEEACEDNDHGSKDGTDWLQELNEAKGFQQWIKNKEKNEENAKIGEMHEIPKLYGNKQIDQDTKSISQQAKFALTLPITSVPSAAVVFTDITDKKSTTSEKTLSTASSDLIVNSLTKLPSSNKKSKRKNKTSVTTVTASTSDTAKAKCDLLKFLPAASIKQPPRFQCGRANSSSGTTLSNLGLLTKDELILPPRTPFSLADLTAQFQSVSFTAGTFGSITNSSCSSSSSSTSSTCSSKKISGGVTTTDNLTATTTQSATRLSINLTRKPTSGGINSLSSSGNNKNSNCIAAIISELTGNTSGDEQTQTHKHDSQVTQIRKKDAQFKKKQSKHTTTTTTSAISCGQMNGGSSQTSLIVSGSTGLPSISCSSSQSSTTNPSKESISSSPSSYTETLDHLLRHAASSIEVSESALHSLLASLRSPQSIEQLTSSHTTSSLPLPCQTVASQKQDQEKRSPCTSTPPTIPALIQQHKTSITKDTDIDDANNNIQKHCDFCYCEFLEHIGPNGGTSAIHLTGSGTVCASIGGSSSQRNAEIREKLRIRLTKRRVQASQTDSTSTTSTTPCCQATTVLSGGKKITDTVINEQQQVPVCTHQQKTQMKDTEKKNVHVTAAQTNDMLATQGNSSTSLVTTSLSQNQVKNNNTTNANTNINVKQTGTVIKPTTTMATAPTNNSSLAPKTSHGTPSTPVTHAINCGIIDTKKVISNNNTPVSANSSLATLKTNSQTQTRASVPTANIKTAPSSATASTQVLTTTTTQIAPKNEKTEIEELVRFIEDKNEQSTTTNAPATASTTTNSGSKKKSKKKKQQQQKVATTTVEDTGNEKLKINKTITDEQQIKIIAKPQANLQITSQPLQTLAHERNSSTTTVQSPIISTKGDGTEADQASTTSKKKRTKKPQQNETTATKTEEPLKQSKMVNGTTSEIITTIVRPDKLTKKEQKKKISTVTSEPQQSDILIEDRSRLSPPVTTPSQQDVSSQQSSYVIEEHPQLSPEEEVNWITISRKQSKHKPTSSTTTQESTVQSAIIQKPTYYQSQHIYSNSNNSNTTNSKRLLNPSGNKTICSSKPSVLTKSSSTTTTGSSSKLHTSNNYYQQAQKDQQNQQHSSTSQISDSTYYNSLRYMTAPPPPRLQNLLKNHASHQTRYQSQLSQTNLEDNNIETNHNDISSIYNSSWNEHEQHSQQQQISQPTSQVNISEYVIRNSSISPSPSSNFVHIPLQQAPVPIPLTSTQTTVPSLMEESSLIEQDPPYWTIIDHQDIIQSQQQIIHKSPQQQYSSSIDSSKIIQRPQPQLTPAQLTIPTPTSLYQQQMSQTQQQTFSPAPGTPISSQSSSSTSLINRCIQRPNSSASPNPFPHKQITSPQPSSTLSYPFYSPMNYAQMNDHPPSPFPQWNHKQEQWKYQQQSQSTIQPLSSSYPAYHPFASGIQNPTALYLDSQRYDQEQQQQQYRRTMGTKQELFQENNMNDEDVFMPRVDGASNEMDLFDREIEEFKKFCLESKPLEQREKVNVNVERCFERQS
ncbi:unnamed protein product, partial [Didymodactylos carnosus]